MPSQAAAGSRWKTKRILHFAPALLLVIAWLSSGLEKGAALILSIIVVAVLVIRALAPRIPRAPAGDAESSAYRAIGRQLFLFAPALLLALLWQRYEVGDGTVYAFIAVLQTVLLARIYPRVPLRRWIPGLLLMSLLALGPGLYERRQTVIREGYAAADQPQRHSANGLQCRWLVDEARKGSSFPRKDGTNLYLGAQALGWRDFEPPLLPTDPPGARLVLTLKLTSVVRLSRLPEYAAHRSLGVTWNGRVIGLAEPENPPDSPLVVRLDEGVDRDEILGHLQREFQGSRREVAIGGRRTDGFELRLVTVPSQGVSFLTAPGMISGGRIESFWLSSPITAPGDIEKARFSDANQSGRRRLTLEFSSSAALKISKWIRSSPSSQLAVVWRGRVLRVFAVRGQLAPVVEIDLGKVEVDEKELVESILAAVPPPEPQAPKIPNDSE